MPAPQLIRFRHDPPHYKSLRRERETAEVGIHRSDSPARRIRSLIDDST